MVIPARRQATRSARWLAAVLAILTVAVSLEPLVHSDAGHDPHFAIEVHDASQHRFTAPPAGDEARHGAEHCVVCHLFRYSRGSDTRSVDARVELRAVLVSRTDEDGRLAAGSAVSLPARAPPARS